MKTIYAIPALLLALAAPALSGQARPAPGRHVPAAQPDDDPLRLPEALLEKQKYAEAEEKLQGLMPAQAKNPQAWFDLGYAQSHQGKGQEAVASYQKAVALAPDWFEANRNLGLELSKSGNFSAAVPVLTHTVELKPASGGQALGQAWISLAQALEKADPDPRKAAAAYDEAAELNHSDPELVVRAGNLLQRSGDLTGAEQRYRTAAEAGNAGGMAQLIDLLTSQKRFTDAETWLNKYVAQNPQSGSARAQLGRLLALQGKKDEAIAMLQPLSGPGASPAINRELAALHLDNKQYAEATALLKMTLEKSPDDPQLHLDLGVALLHQLKYAESEAELLKAAKLKPDLADTYGYLAEAARQNQHYELCLRALDARARFQPETPGTYFLRATAYDSLRAYKQAAENYKLFLDAAGGKFPDQEFQARHRLKAITPQ
jgi:tetratricopeptide (TPR) repeat protein